MFAGTFAPVGWASCNGQLLSITQSTALFSLLGTQFGGDGRTNFGLPNLQGAFPVGMGQGAGLTPRVMGEVGGVPSVALTTGQIPAHTHAAQGLSTGGNTDSPSGGVWAQGHGGKAPIVAYSTAGSGVAMNASALATAGGSQPHNNLPPFTVLTFIIALQGVFPARG